MAEQTVTLQPGESKVVTFEALPHEARAYQVSVDGLGGSFVVSPILSPTYGQPSISFGRYGAFTIAQLTTIVTNPNPAPVSCKLYCYWRWATEPETIKRPRFWCPGGVDHYQLELAEGQSKEIVSPFACYFAGMERWNTPYIGSSVGALLWFEDELGGKSPVIGPY